jgi:hypothetical protein
MKRSLWLLAGILFSLSLWAQTDANKGQIGGTVLDPNQAAVPNAKVTIKNTATNVQREMTTGESGQFRAVALDPGTYDVTINATGFAPTVAQGVLLNVGGSVNLPITLAVGTTSTTIEVTSTLTAIDLPAPTTTISTLAIQNLPINGRRFQDFATLTPTVIVEPSRSQISFAGQRAINSNIMVDGADYNQPFFGGIRGGERSNSIITVPQSSVQEFQAITTGYAAEYGRSTGGILNVISKSGTNAWHGDAFYQNRNSSLSANGPIPVPDLTRPGTLINVQPAESLQQWGGGVGGPLKADKLFLFVSYEQQHAVQPRQVVFNALVGYNATTPQMSAYNYYKGQEQKFNKTNNAGAGVVRGDYSFSNGSRLTLRYNRSGSEEANAVTVGGAIEAFTTNTLGSEGTEIDRVHFGSAQLTSIFSPSLLNDLKFSGSYEARPRLSNSTAPGLVASTIGTAGTRNFLPTVQDDSRYQITDALSWTKSTHTIKVGVDYNKLHSAQTFGFDQYGTFTISSSNVSQILDILSGAGTVAHRFDSPTVSYSRQIGNLAVDYGATQAALFAQDSWRVTPSLTIDYGLRWEGQWNPSVTASNDALVSKVNSVTFPNNARTDVTKIADNLAQVMPRLGFAWSPGKARRFVVRGHGGIFYAATPLLIYSDPTGNFRNPPNNVRLFLNNTSRGTIYQQFLNAGVDLDKTPLDQLPIIPLTAVQQAASFGLGTAPDPFAGAGTTTMATDYKNPRSVQFGIGSDVQLTRNWTAGIQFNYVNTVHLERNRDYNLPIPSARDASGRPLYCIAVCTPAGVRPIPSLGQINVRESSARSLYRGFSFTTGYRGRKFQGGVSYSLAWNYSDDDNERDSGGQAAMDSFNYRQDYGYSNLDTRHTAGLYGVYDLPFGFTLSATFTARSALPLNPRTGADTNGDTANTDRALFAPGAPFARNSFRNRAVYGDNLRLLKSFRLKSETRRVELSAEFFNVLNIDNVLYGTNGQIYGLGISTAGAPVAIDPRFQLYKTADGRYSTQNTQYGFPFQAQFGARFFF